MSRTKRNILLVIIAAAAVGFICLGLLRGENRVMFSRAVTVCLECIGLGR